MRVFCQPRVDKFLVVTLRHGSPAGTVFDKATQSCQPCSDFEYSVSPSLAQCATCPALRSSTNTSKSSADDCVCIRGFYFKQGTGCEECPPGVLCGQNGLSTKTLILEQKFWRSSETSLKIRPCLRSGNCKGGSAVGQGLCKLGSEGWVHLLLFSTVHFQSLISCIRALFYQSHVRCLHTQLLPC